MPNQYSAVPFVERFWAKVNKDGPAPSHCPELGSCWLWTGKPIRGGYGRIHWNGRPVGAHRASYELAFGSFPSFLRVLHRCDTPACVRPAHLFLGTTADNMRDRNAKGRQAKGDRAGPRARPETRPRGDENGSRTHPESRPRGERNTKSKFTAAQVLEMRRAYAAGETNTSKLAREFGVANNATWQIIRRKTWRHLPDEQGVLGGTHA